MTAANASGPGLPRTLDVATLPPRVRRVLEQLLQTAANELGRQLQVVLHETELELERMATPVRGNAAGTSHGTSLRSLRQHSEELISGFLRELETGLAQLQAPRVSRRPDHAPTTALTLSLVDDVELDEDDVLAGIATRSDSRNSLALQLMGQRFGVLAGGPAFDAEHLPLGPHALCYSLRNAGLALELPLDARLALYRQFDKVVVAQLPSLLDILNDRLSEEGVLPHLSFVPVRRRPAQPREAGGRGASESTKTAAPVEHGSAQAALPARVEAGAAGTGGDGFAGLQDLLARRRQLLAKLRASVADERVRETMGHDEVLRALRHMRGSQGKTGTASDVRQTLLAQARQQSGHGVALGDADSDGFELFGLFLGQLHREMRRESPGDAMVERLKLPVLQLALRDHRFFIDPAHPARMLLDAVSLAGAQWLADDDLDAQWLGLLQRAVGTVQEDPEAGHDTFVAANYALQGGLQSAARKNALAERRHVDAVRGREKLELARLRAHAEIARLVGGRHLPRFHSMLMEQAWTDVLSLTLLRSGEASEAWRDIREATSAVIEASCSPGERTPDPALLATLHDALAQVGYHAEDAAMIARQLAHGRSDDADLASRTELVVQLKARARLGEDTLARDQALLPPRSAAEQAAYAKLGTAKQGRWVDLHNPAHNSVVRRRLMWTSARSGHVLLLNRRSLRIEGFDLDGLARMLAAGTLQLVEDDVHPAEQAWKLTLANLQRIAGERRDASGATHES